MKHDVSITIGDRVFPLEARMRRVRLLHELTGVDFLTQSSEEVTKRLREVGNLTAAIYALAGGERKTSMTLEDFEEEIEFSEYPALLNKLKAVFERDTSDATGQASPGNAEAGG